MHRMSRRGFLVGTGGTLLATHRAWAQLGVGGRDTFDLVIKGGQVLDPSQNLRARRDIGIRNAKVVALDADIPVARAAQVLDAEGKLVTAGLVDLHAHVFPGGSSVGLPADELVPFTATTTYVDAGDAGASTFSAFKHLVVGQTRSRVFAFLHISKVGLTPFPVGEMRDIDFAQVDLAAKVVAENQDVVLGVKVRESKPVVGDNGLEPLRRALAAAELSGTQARVMCHIGDAPGELSALLDLLRPGDILTHAYSGAGNNIVQNGKLLPAALDAMKRGVLIDVGHGGGSFDFDVAEAAMQQGLLPSTISSDIHAYSGNSPSMPYLPWVMSKFLALGLPLEQVVALATVHPGRLIGRVDKLGTLQVGAPADVSIFELVEGRVEFEDTAKKKRTGKQFLKPVQTVRAGRAFGRPYSAPFMSP